MKKCINCKHYFTRDICGFCSANDNIREIKHPLLMGGKKCECYEKRNKQENKFEYPKKIRMNNTKKPTHQLVLSEIINIESYTDEDCKKCGRHRVELISLSSGNKYHICEKCRYIREQDRYCEDIDFSYDVFSNGKTYLIEVLNGSENNEN